MNFTYILECGDGTYYTGWTNDMKKRLEAHRSGNGAKYTRGRDPVRLVYLEAFAFPEEAMRREASIKKMRRADKLSLIRSDAWKKRLEEWGLKELQLQESADSPG